MKHGLPIVKVELKSVAVVVVTIAIHHDAVPTRVDKIIAQLRNVAIGDSHGGASEPRTIGCRILNDIDRVNQTEPKCLIDIPSDFVVCLELVRKRNDTERERRHIELDKLSLDC